MNNSIINKEYRVLENMDLSHGTKEDYLNRVKDFLVFTKRNIIDQDVMVKYKRQLEANTSLSVSSKNKYLTVAKIYLRELYRRGLIERDFTVGIKSFRQSKKHKKFGHSQEDVQKLLAQLERESLRDKVIVYLMLYQGLRQCEVVRIEYEDIDFKNRTVKILGKGNHDKEVVYLHPKTKEVLKEYVDVYYIRSGRLFDLTERSIRNIHDKIADKLGIEATTHGLRHFFATKVLETFNGNVIEAAKYTRHKTLDMLQVYNDNIDHQKSLPEYEKAFSEI